MLMSLSITILPCDRKPYTRVSLCVTHRYELSLLVLYGNRFFRCLYQHSLKSRSQFEMSMLSPIGQSSVSKTFYEAVGRET